MKFQVKWAMALKVHRSKVAMNFPVNTVCRAADIGIRAEWPYSFIESSAFLKVLKKDWFAPGLKIKSIKIRSPDGVLIEGVLFQEGTIPDSVPQIRVVLYTDEKVARREFLLDQAEGLHDEHGRHIQTWRLKQDITASGEGRIMKHAEIAASWAEAERMVGALDTAAKLQKRQREKSLELIDAAEQAARRGDAASAAALARAAAVTTTVSGSRLRGHEHESSGGASSSGFLAPKAPLKRKGVVSETPSPADKRAKGGGRCSSASTVALKMSSASRLGSSASVASVGGRSAQAPKSSASRAGDMLDLMTDIDDGTELDVKDMTLDQLLQYVMGPKSYSQGTEIRGVVSLVASVGTTLSSSECLLSDHVFNIIFTCIFYHGLCTQDDPNLRWNSHQIDCLDPHVCFRLVTKPCTHCGARVSGCVMRPPSPAPFSQQIHLH